MAIAPPDGRMSPDNDAEALHDLCRTVFETLNRADQRRWAEVYVRGLVEVPGRKSIRRIARQRADRAAEQALQQFVNQSPWDWSPVRQALARAVHATVAPLLWTVQEVEFPKDGRNSVGVESQYAVTAQRTLNCQLGLAVWVAGDEGSVPVNWRLMLPPSWDIDPERRAKAHVPDSERHRPFWEHILDAVDEMVESWGLAPRPVAGDLRHDRQLEPLLRGLEERRLGYALRIADRSPVTSDPHGGPVYAGDLMHSAARRLVSPPVGHGHAGRHDRRRPPLVVAEAVVPAAAPGSARRRVLARWPKGRSRPGELWLTNLATEPVPDLLDLMDLAGHTASRCDELRKDSGLDHFEGRSFRGWHHHVTLASVAHAYGVLQSRQTLLLPRDLRRVR